MDELDQFGIQRELLTVEQRLYAIRESFIGYTSGDETSEVKALDATIKKVRSLQLSMRRWFAPDR